MKTCPFHRSVIVIGTLLCTLFHNERTLAATCSNPSFVTAGTYAAGASPSAVATADFNGDGKPDLAVANEFSGNVSVLLGRSDGSFQAAVNYGAGSAPSAVVASDFNGDGKPDLVVANSGSGDVSALLGNGDGTFQAAVNVSTADAPRSIAVGDFNGDGKRDLAVANRVSAIVSVLLGNGNGTFQAASTNTAGIDPVFVAVGDLNGDGKLDLVAANAALFDDPPSVSVLLGNGNGTFQAAVNYPAGMSPRSILVADFNGDGKADVAVANYGSFVNNVLSGSGVSVLLGTGNGTLQSPVPYGTGAGSVSVTGGDLNGDGVTDLVVGNDRSANVSVLLGNGNGSFQTANNYGGGASPRSVVVADFNADGQADLAVANSGGISALLNTCAPFGDLAVTLAGLPAVVQTGQNVTYTIVATNKGSISDNNVTISDTLPSGVNFVSVTASQGTTTRNGNLVSASVGTLNAGAGAIISIVVTLTTPGSYTNVVNISGSGSDSNPGNNSASVVNAANTPPANTPPSISTIANQVINEDTATPAIAFTISDAETGAGLLTVSGASSNPSLIPDANVVLGGSGANRTVTITPLPNKSGITTNTITVSDGQATASTTFILTVNAVNDPPALASISNQTVTEGSTLSFICTATDPDLPADTLTFSLDPGAPVGASINAASGAFTWTPSAAQAPSTNPITVRVTDNGVPPLSDFKSFTVVVTQAGGAPLLAVARSGTTFTISWPSPSTGFVLESTTSLRPANWQPAGETPTDSNGRRSVTIPLDLSERYFRLRNP